MDLMAWSCGPVLSVAAEPLGQTQYPAGAAFRDPPPLCVRRGSREGLAGSGKTVPPQEAEAVPPQQAGLHMQFGWTEQQATPGSYTTITHSHGV